MLKKLDILGLELDNYTVREAMMKVELYLENNEFNIIETITMNMIEKSRQDSIMHKCLQSLDLAVIGEKEILIAAGEQSMQRIRETRDNDFFSEFMKRIIRNKKTVYLIGEEKEELSKLRMFLEEEYERIQIVGGYTLQECVGDLDSIINAVNVESPSIILSILPSPRQEYFLMECKGKLNVKVWYGLGDYHKIHSNFHSFLRWARKKIHRKKLISQLNQYHSENKEE